MIDEMDLETATELLAERIGNPNARNRRKRGKGVPNRDWSG